MSSATTNNGENKMIKRTDIHRPSVIKPKDYKFVLFYNLPTTEDGFQIPAFGVEKIVEMRKNLEIKWARTGGIGQCSVCGSRFIYGELWCHVSTGEHIHIGHVCAKNYGLFANYRQFSNDYSRFKTQTIKELREKLRKERIDKKLASVPGLVEVLNTEHYIVQDIKERLYKYGDISENQIALVFKLANEVNKEPKKFADVPVGKHTVKGVILSTKLHYNDYGSQLKMIVEVDCGDSSYKLWGTVPNCLITGKGDLEGKTIQFTATLSRGRDAGFGFFKRPRKVSTL